VQSVLARLDHAIVDAGGSRLARYKDGRTLFCLGMEGAQHCFTFRVRTSEKDDCRKAQTVKTVALTDNVCSDTAWANDKPTMRFSRSSSRAGGKRRYCTGNFRKWKFAERDSRTGSGIAGWSANAGADWIRRWTGKTLADLCLVVPSDSMQLIEDAHLCATHAIFLAIRQRMMQTNGD